VSKDEVHFRVMRLIQEHPQLTQRELARRLGVSLGKANYCLKALIEKGFVKAENFQRSDHKLAYAYLLTPAGIDEKARVTVSFLRRKMQEFEALKAEIEGLQAMAGQIGEDHSVRNEV
jgi:EPS-associated MarR family transcriptional regulator